MKLDKGSELNKPKEVQLSFMDFQLGQTDFVESKKSGSTQRYSSYYRVEADKTPRFLTLSAIVHAAAFFTLAFAAVPLIEEVKTETITVELEESQPVRQISKGAEVPATQGATPEPEAAKPIEQKAEQKIVSEDLKLPEAAPTPTPSPEEILGGKDEVLVAKKEAAKPVIEKAKPVKAAPAKVAKAATPAKSASSVAAKTTMQAVPASIEDIQDPELDQGAVADHSEQSNLNEDFNDDYENVNRTQAAALAKEKEQMENLASALAAEQDETLNSVAAQNAAEAEKLAAYNKSLRQKNAESIASAEAAERAAADAAAAKAAAVQKSREEAAAKAAALAAAQAKAASKGSGKGQGAGAGNSGSSQASNQVAGSPTGVRSLDQLRQMPGNPRPQYSPDERLKGHMGDVGFLAYITKEGQPTQFRMIKSTGFQNLDSKTLAALQKWRFYPGQEGWVELPFKWDLKGETQEAGGLLRKKVSSR